MRGFKFTLVFVFCLLVCSGVMSAQNDWDSVLDRYENIAAQCKALRDKAAAGEPVSQKSVTTLFGELGRLRNTLQRAEGKMTRAQRERFQAIRESYEGGKILRSAQNDKAGAQNDKAGPLNDNSGAQKDKWNNTRGDRKGQNVKADAANGEETGLAENKIVKLDPLPVVDGGKILRFAQNDSRYSLQNDSLGSLQRDSCATLQKDCGSSLENANPVILSEAKGETKDLSVKRFNVLPTLSLGDTRQAGLFLAMTRGRLGGYISIRTNFVSQLYAYDILSDGTTGGETLFEAKGGQRIGEYSAVAGIVRNITPWLDLYAGGGYGSSTLCWNDSWGAWAKVRDYSAAGILLDGGAMFHIGRVSLLGGISWLTARPESGPFKPVFTVGAGLGF